MERTFLEDRQLGPDPHGRSRLQVLKAYARGAALDGPQILLNPWLPRQVVRKLALRRFRHIVEHAAAKVPFYRDQLQQAGVRPEQLRTTEDLQRVPFLTKPLLREHNDRMMASDAPPRERLLERASSGSSGTPVKLYFDPIGELPRRLQELRLLVANGFRPWHSQLIFDHPAHMAPSSFLPQKLGLWRREKFPAWEPVEDALKMVRKTKPDILHAVLSSLRLMALAVRASGPLGYTPLFSLSKGELLDGLTRQLIESTFGSRLVDYYAIEETGIIAWECPRRTGYHIDEDLVLVETVKEDGTPAAPGETGEVVLTNLYQRTMPFIRYRVGDLAVLTDEPCPCGRGLPLLKQLQGRKVDLIVTPEGYVHHPMVMMGVLEETKEVRTFRMEQKALDLLSVEVNWDDGLSAEQKAAAERKVVEGLNKLLGDATRIEVKEVPPFRHQMGQKFALVKGLRKLDELKGTIKVRF